MSSLTRKNRYCLFISTIGIALARAKVTLANLAYNWECLMVFDRRAITAKVRLRSTEVAERPNTIAEKRQIRPLR